MFNNQQVKFVGLEKNQIIKKVMHELKIKDSDFIYDNEHVQKLIDNLNVSKEKIQFIRQVNQRTPQWFIARNGVIDYENNIFIPPRLTASRVGTVLKHNKKETQFKLLQNLIWSEDDQSSKKFNAFAKKIMDKGTAYETLVVKNVTMNLNSKFQSSNINNEIWIEDIGLVIDYNYPWLAASSDGFVHILDSFDETETISGLEIKVPGNNKPYAKIPHEYYDQIMNAMYILNLKDYYFACYTPHETQLSYYLYDSNYWEGECMPKLEDFYWTQLIPSWIIKVHKRLQIGKLQNEHVITFSFPPLPTDNNNNNNDNSSSTIMEQKSKQKKTILNNNNVTLLVANKKIKL